MASAAPTFDVDGYSACTATTVPAPDEGFDAVVTRCCVQHAGVPADTRYGVGCVAAADSLSTEERPTIVLPTRPSPPEDSQDIQDALKDLGDRPLPDPTP
jgi:hypothetical protein